MLFKAIHGVIWLISQVRSWVALAVLLFALILMPAEAEARYASIVIDADTGRVLHQTNADTRNYPASLTKIMTLYMVFEALQDGRLTLQQSLKVSRRAAGMPASKLGLRAGARITVETAILALTTKSANDVAVVVAEALGGTESNFAQLMTERAHALGMSRTSFRNASGLPNRRQLSTARDMAKLGGILLERFPAQYRYFSTKTFKYKGRSYRNHNKLLKSYRGTDGIKTGYTRASGFNLVASVERGGRRLIAVVFGGKTGRSRDRHMTKLLNRGFAKLTAVAAIKKDLRPPARKPLQLAAAKTKTPGRAAPAKSSLAKSPPANPAPKIPPVPKISPGPKIVDVAPVAASGRWGVQVGAFYRYAPAQRAAQRASQSLPDLLGDSRLMVTYFDGRRGRIYRARLVGLSETVARSACQRLQSIKTDCLVVQVSKGVSVAQRS